MRLRSPDVHTRVSATYALRDRRERKVFDALLDRISDANEHHRVRLHALRNLRAGGSEPELLPRIVEFLELEPYQLRNEALVAVQAYGPRASACVPRLTELLRSTDSRGPAARALAAVAGRNAIPALIKSLEIQRNYAAADVLGEMRAAEAVPALIEALARGGNVRSSAARALGLVGDPSAIPALEAAYSRLPDRPVGVRAEMLRAIALLGRRTAVRRLLELLNDRIVPEQQVVVLQRIAGLVDHRIPEALLGRRRTHDTPEVMCAVLDALGASLRIDRLLADRTSVRAAQEAEMALFIFDDVIATKGREALEAMLGITLAPEEGERGDPLDAARRAWARFVVREIFSTISREGLPPLAEEEEHPIRVQGTQARRAYDWIDLRGEAYVPELVEYLTDTRPLLEKSFWSYHYYDGEDVDLSTVAHLAMRALRRCEKLPFDRRVVDALLARLTSADEAQVLEAAVLVAWFDDDYALRQLVEAWRDANSDVARRAIGRALCAASSHVATFVGAFRSMMAADDPLVRHRAVDLLRGSLVEAMWQERKRTYAALQSERTRRHVDPDHLNPRVVAMLDELHRASVRALLEPALRDSWDLGRDTRLWVAEVAGRYQVRTAVPLLRAALRETDPELAAIAIRSLETLGASEAIADIAPYLSSPDARSRAAAARALGELRADGVLVPLRALLVDSEYGVAAEAAHAVSLLGDIESAPAVAALLSHGYALCDGTATVVAAAARLKARAAIPRLLEISDASDAHPAEAAIEALGVLGGPPEVAALAKLSRTNGKRLKAALTAIGRIGGPEAREICLQQLAAGYRQNSPAAAHALALTGDRRGYDALSELSQAPEARDALQQLTGRTFGLPVDPTEKELRSGIARWQQWWRTNRDRFGVGFDD